MKKKVFLFVLPLVFGSLVACGGSNSNPDGPVVDPTKVTIKVSTLDLGFGDTWLRNIASRYETLHKDDKYGDKVGVQVIVNSDTNSLSPNDGSNILSDDTDVYFRENMNIKRLINDGALLDLTSVFNETNSYDNKTISSKISEDDLKLYSDNNGKIYGGPSTSGSYGIVYNKDVFSKKKLYIAKDSPIDAKSPSEVKLIAKSGSAKSAGYNDIRGDYDDGLPRTYAEFLKVLEVASGDGSLIPIGWSSVYAEAYISRMSIAAYASAAGYEQAKLRFSFDGTATNLGSIVGSGFVLDKNPKLITNDNTGNGYEIMRSKANFDTLTFLDQMLNKSTYYLPQSSSFDNFTLQDYMIKGYGDKQMAMCIEGSWFYNECAKHISPVDLDSYNYGFMPIPKATFDGVTDKKYTYVEGTNSCAFIKGNILDKTRESVAVDFLKYFYSDSELLEFLSTTKCTVGVKYPEVDKTSEFYTSLNSFGQDVYEMTQTSNRLNTNYPNTFYNNNKVELSNDNFLKADSTLINPYSSFVTRSLTPAQYFSRMVAGHNKEQWSQLASM